MPNVSIHPSAIVSPSAQIGSNVQIGPFCLVESGVVIGDDCILDARVSVKEGTTLGANNRVFEGTILGGLPQHVHIPEQPGRVTIGSNNTIRENVTVHRALLADHATEIGDNCLFMVNAHVAHDCRIGNHVIVTNNAMLAGHVHVDDRAYVSGAVGVHQFCRVGTLAMVGGQAHLVQDVPPYVTVDGLSSLVVGLNKIGLRRAGFSNAAIQELMEAYRLIYRSGLRWAEVLEQLRTSFPAGPAAEFYEFLSTTARGIVSERRAPPAATIKLREPAETEPEVRVKFG
ncbi:MAG: acyl-ACP--UDP-N-acetylglucosamine O-acyltransferase [Planctomycetaceae bacterium]|nr:acyl-ACP--UDP-N-acetylglucosamine O-acyltransferase [Planctomycetaceae bacterium]